MTPQEQASLDRVFGRIHVRTGTGGFRPLAGTAPAPQPKPAEVSPAAQTTRIEVPVVAPKQETSPLLAQLAKTLPTEAGKVIVTTKPAE